MAEARRVSIVRAGGVAVWRSFVRALLAGLCALVAVQATAGGVAIAASSNNPATEGAKPATITAPPITPTTTTTKGAQTAAATRTPTRIKNREHSATEPDGEM